MSLLIVEQSNEEISAGNNSLKERNKNINHSNNIVKDTPKRKYEEKKVHRVCIPTRVQKRNEKVRFWDLEKAESGNGIFKYENEMMGQEFDIFGVAYKTIEDSKLFGQEDI